MTRPPLTYAEIRSRYVERERPLPASIERALRDDPRPSAKAILAAVDRRRREHRAEGQRLRGILRYERELWATGIVNVAGLDEAGMSPLAGPVAAAAVVFPPGFRLPEIDDSKKLDAKTRERLAPIIRDNAAACAVGFVESDEIDRINIYWAGLLAMMRALDGLAIKPEHLLIDGRKLRDTVIPQQRIDKGDEKSLSIAAASILAKTARDARMLDYDARFPEYGFAQHKGYPVRAHVEMLRRHGPCEIHRQSFAPVRKVLGLPPLPPWPVRTSVYGSAEPSSEPNSAELAAEIESVMTDAGRADEG
jgi:ribonuclease HII